MAPLPTFRYHPDPVATEVVISSANGCRCCGQARGFVYDGPAYGLIASHRCICPWCIADGTAHGRLGVTFNDPHGVGGGGWCDAVPDAVVDEVSCRTPGFNGWQQEQWWTHCGDAAAFLGPAGRDELAAHGPEAVAAVRASGGLDDGPQWQAVFRGLSRTGSPTAYLFRCLHCDSVGGYWDCD